MRLFIGQGSQKRVLAAQVNYCDRFRRRLKGLLGTSQLAHDQACWIIPCNQVHTLGMRYSLDLYFLNKSNRIVRIISGVKPWRITPIIWDAHSVLEFSSSELMRGHIGDVVDVEMNGKASC